MTAVYLIVGLVLLAIIAMSTNSWLGELISAFIGYQDEDEGEAPPVWLALGVCMVAGLLYSWVVMLLFA